MSATKTKKDTRQKTHEKSRTEPPWNVVLYNDWDNSMPKVVYVLVRTIPGMNVRRATALMYEAHSKGQSTVKRCHQELAEMYAGKLQRRGLTAGASPMVAKSARRCLEAPRASSRARRSSAGEGPRYMNTRSEPGGEAPCAVERLLR